MPRRRYTIEDCRVAARKHGGECLSDTYTQILAKMQWRCAAGHEWSTTFRIVNDGHWCPECVKAKYGEHFRLSIDHARRTAEAKGGQCLSTGYRNQKTPLRWKCGRADHKEWTASYTSVLNAGHWCPQCGDEKVQEAIERRRLPDGLGVAKRVAGERGGECLSGIYLNIFAPMEWKCREGHVWRNNLGHIRAGQWCPSCSGSRREGECRAIIERLLKKRFPEMKPSWMKQTRLLDGYNEELRLAFEYNGQQHYQYTPVFHRNGEQDLARQQRRDQEVAGACDDNWITLIVIPFWIADLETFIANELTLLGYL